MESRIVNLPEAQAFDERLDNLAASALPHPSEHG
jgi:hypothetical protein